MNKNHLLLLLTFLSIALITSCKKDSKPDTGPGTPQGNYLKLNSDTRTLELIPSSLVAVNNGAWTNPDQWELHLAVKSDFSNIAGLNNDRFDIIIRIWDKNLTNSEYELVPGFSAGSGAIGPSGKASIGMRLYASNGSELTFFDVQSGKIKITKESSGRLKSVEFIDLPLNNSYIVSGRFNINF